MDVYENDRVTLVINPWNYDTIPAEVTGTVTKAPSEDEWTRQKLADAKAIMVDFSVTCEETGDVYTWNVDNGYVLGPHPSLGRRSDVGRFRRFQEPDE